MYLPYIWMFNHQSIRECVFQALNLAMIYIIPGIKRYLTFLQYSR